MDGENPEVFTAQKQEVTGPALLALIVGVSIICVLIVAGLGSAGIDSGGMVVPYYISYLVGIPFFALVDWIVYRRLKDMAPSGNDRVEVHSDHVEIYKGSDVRRIGFGDIMGLTAITNSYGIIFLQIDVAEGMVKIVGMNDLQGLFDSMAKHLSPYIVKKENFLKRLASKE